MKKEYYVLAKEDNAGDILYLSENSDNNVLPNVVDDLSKVKIKASNLTTAKLLMEDLLIDIKRSDFNEEDKNALTTFLASFKPVRVTEEIEFVEE